jgi:hypothetical protein
MSEAPVEAGVDDVQPVPRKTGRGHFDVIVSLTAIFISALSLYVAIQHGKTERDLVAANVWPFPRAILNNGGDPDGMIKIGVSNGGVGPAKVRSFELFYGGHPVSSGLDLLRRCCGLPNGIAAVKTVLPRGYYFSIADETVLRPGEENPVLQLNRKSAPQIGERLAAAVPHIGFRVCYCSVLDQCWIGDLRSTRTQPVGECRPPEHPYAPNGL